MGVGRQEEAPSKFTPAFKARPPTLPSPSKGGGGGPANKKAPASTRAVLTGA